MSGSWQELGFASPWINAAGSQGFSPARDWPWCEPQGGFFTNPISLGQRTPANDRTCLPFAGGFLLHTGLVNPGLRRVLQLNRARWQRSNLPIWVHLIGTPTEIHHMTQLLEDEGLVAGLEIGIPPEATPGQALELVSAAVGELPVLAAIALNRANESWLAQLAEVGAAGLTITPPRGCLADTDGKLVRGRLYGPALFPQTLAAVQTLSVGSLPIVVSVGIFTLGQGQTLLQTGAAALGLDAALWQPTNIPSKS